jgi:hypothetical protein
MYASLEEEEEVEEARDEEREDVRDREGAGVGVRAERAARRSEERVSEDESR